MKTAFGYIGADSFTRQRQEGGQKSRRVPGREGSAAEESRVIRHLQNAKIKGFAIVH
jgi:hypothetical protein